MKTLRKWLATEARWTHRYDIEEGCYKSETNGQVLASIAGALFVLALACLEMTIYPY